MTYFCCDTLRRSATAASAFNGIDFVEVVDLDAPTPALRQRLLHIYLLKDPAPLVLTADNFRIEGGERIRDIRVTTVTMAPGGQANLIEVEVDRAGDFSFYRLSLAASLLDSTPPPQFDAMLASVEFSFKAECPTSFDCRPRWICPSPPDDMPAIDYLARDYESFRRTMLDRMATTIPNWTERNPADLGVTLVELLAFVGDDLSWRQEDAHTEAFLGRARRRASVRRLARLVDYRMSDGANARTYVHIDVSADVVPVNPGDPPAVPVSAAFTTVLGGRGVSIPADPALLARAHAVFEPMEQVDALYSLHHHMPFYSWSDARCLLPSGSTRATLAGHFPNLRAGEVLIFEEVVGPRTGNQADADPMKRHPVRLTLANAMSGAVSLIDPVTGALITEIAWRDEDALPFPLCISSITDEEFGATSVPEVSVARGNIVLVDNGQMILDEALGTVPGSDLAWAGPCGGDPCTRTAPVAIAPRFRPTLKQGPLTQALPLNATASATQALTPTGVALPSRMRLASVPGTDPWLPLRDLLSLGAFDQNFVAEVEIDGTATLRFGDDAHGRRPPAGMSFTADYRVGNGSAGNVGHDTLVHTTLPHPEIITVRNPLAARGGVDAETIEEVRQRAPFAFRRQERAVTRDDYAEVALRMGGLQAARATWRHTGSWHTIFVTADRKGGLEIDDVFAGRVRDFLEIYRLAGRDLEADAPHTVALELELAVCVLPDYFRADVAQALTDLFSNHALPDGRLGLFHPDRFSFGQTVYLSPLIAAAQAVAGVASVEATVFQRFGIPSPAGLSDGLLRFDRLEIARLDNDQNFPEHGEFRLTLRDGK
jgi:Baseplate J-like protein